MRCNAMSRLVTHPWSPTLYRPSRVPAEPGRPQGTRTRTLGDQQALGDGVGADITFRVQVRHHGG